MTTLLILAVLAVAQTPDSISVTAGVRNPAFSADGRIAVDFAGDIWVSRLAFSEKGMSESEGLVQVTSGAAWDHQAAWMADGAGLVFSSDRGGSVDLWLLRLDSDGAPGALERLTENPESETEPAVGPDGTIIFVLGRNATADLWSLAPDGSLEQITDRKGGEFSPSITSDGQGLVYVSVVTGKQTLRYRTLSDGKDKALSSVAGAHPAWSPDGQLIAYTTRSGRRGVWVTPRDGRYSNLVSETPAAPAWSPSGDYLALAALPPAGPGYNGDPDRLGDREIGNLVRHRGGLTMIPAPRPLYKGADPIALTLERPRSAYNREAFDRVWERLERLYLDEAVADQWRATHDTYRPRAVAAASDAELERVIYEMLRNRPAARRTARGKAAVSSAHSLATAAGVEMLERGGNVIDAAVAVSFALGVVEPDASGVGGYGEMVAYLRGMDEPVVIEFLTRVPEQATLSNASLLENGRLPADGPVLANVPGTVAGMHKAFEMFGSGKVAWADLLAPAIRLAEEGFVLDEAFTTTLDLERDRFLRYESSKAQFFPDGGPLQSGDTLRNVDLGWTLRQIAEGGAEAFYKGEIARRMVDDLRGQGNAMTAEDLSRYFAVAREPVRGTYRGHTIYSGAPAVSGGASLVSKLHLLENAEDLSLYTDDPAAFHAMIEAWKLQPSSRGLIADPSLWPVNLEPLVSKDSARIRWKQCFKSDRSTGPRDLRLDDEQRPACAQQEVAMSWGEDVFQCEYNPDGCRSTGTTAFAVADGEGNLVSVTQTLGTWGGNFYVTPGLGFIYNDKLRSYGTDPAGYNARVPFARNSTSIAPTLIFKGTGDDREPYVALGAAGNAWITSAVYQMAVGILDAGLGPQQALELPRFLVGVRRSPTDRSEVEEVVIQIEDGFAPDVLRRLEEMGHSFQRISLKGELRMGYGAVVAIENGEAVAGADPRRSGAAGAVH